MSFDASAGSWDFQLPPALPEISDDQFLSLLNAQFDTNIPLNDPFLKYAPVTTNPQALSRFPVNLNLSPLISEESSPSPPASSTDPPSTRSRKLSEHQRGTQSADRSHDDASKRKASFDDDEDDDDEDGQPHRKSFHGEPGPSSANGKKSAPRRKTSLGGNHKDESRLLKRKEQNRAAQRAFRERKEKHVKDLEDQVAVLEAKSDMQAAENENLRDILTRLQSENRALKESSFTFTMNQDESGPMQQQSTSASGQSPQSMAHSPQTHVSVGSSASPPSITRSPPPIDNSMAYFSPAFFNLDALPGGLSPYNYPSPPPSSQQSPYITVASNPLYMSFADNTFSSYLTPSVSSGHSPHSVAAASPAPDVNMSNGSLGDIYQFDGLMPFSGNFDLFSGLDPIPGSSLSPSVSPVIHASSVGSQSQPMDVHVQGNASGCPRSREDMAAKIAAGGTGTFGPPVIVASPTSYSQPSASSSRAERPSAAGAYARMAPHLTGQSTPADVAACSKTLPPADPAVHSVPLKDAWKEVSQHPQFQDCDMDELCLLLKSKARCDGSQAMLEPGTVTALLEKIPSLAQPAQFRK